MSTAVGHRHADRREDVTPLLSDARIDDAVAAVVAAVPDRVATLL